MLRVEFPSVSNMNNEYFKNRFERRTEPKPVSPFEPPQHFFFGVRARESRPPAFKSTSRSVRERSRLMSELTAVVRMMSRYSCVSNDEEREGGKYARMTSTAGAARRTPKFETI